MAFPRKLNQLCSPSFVYFIISVIFLTISVIQNIKNRHSYSLGSFSCRVPNTFLVFVVKVIYILFWTWVLNLICKDGHSGIAWFLIILPFILLFVIIGLIMVYQRKESFYGNRVARREERRDDYNENFVGGVARREERRDNYNENVENFYGGVARREERREEDFRGNRVARRDNRQDRRNNYYN